MKLRNFLLYTAILAFSGWCFLAFRADIARISLSAVWAGRNAVLLATLLSLLNYLLRTIRWSVYLARCGFRFPSGFNGLSYVAGFAFTLSPGKVGEIARARYYKDAGVPFVVTTAAFFVERLMDVFAISCLALLGLATSSGYEIILLPSICIVAGMLLTLAVAPWKLLQRRLTRHRRFGPRLQNALEGVLKTLVSMRCLLHPGLIMFGFLVGLAAWAAEGTGLLILGDLAPAVQITWSTATGIYAIAVIAGALSFLPGGLGSTEIVMIALLAAHGYAMSEAILLTMVCRLITLWFAVAIGWSAVFILRRYPQSVSIKS